MTDKFSKKSRKKSFVEHLRNVILIHLRKRSA